jgi:hypothetical protein
VFSTLLAVESYATNNSGHGIQKTLLWNICSLFGLRNAAQQLPSSNVSSTSKKVHGNYTSLCEQKTMIEYFLGAWLSMQCYHNVYLLALPAVYYSSQRTFSGTIKQISATLVFVSCTKTYMPQKCSKCWLAWETWME